MRLEAGAVADRYELVAPLGRGGQATVWRARHATLGSDHAIKVLNRVGPAVRERLLKEGRAQARLRHPNIVSVTDVLDLDGVPALVMEFVDGPHLGAWIRQVRPDLAQALGVFDGILAGVERAHDAGLVHRDLKPGNVLMASTGVGNDRWLPKVADFGLVKVLHEGADGQTRTGVGMGTPAYMAPEQRRGARHVDHRADIFSLGCILYTLVCGRPPFESDDLLELLTLANTGGYTPPERVVPNLPGRVGQAVRGALEPHVDRRIPDCATLRAVLGGQRPWGLPPDDPSSEAIRAASTVFDSFAEVGAPTLDPAGPSQGAAASTLDPAEFGEPPPGGANGPVVPSAAGPPTGTPARERPTAPLPLPTQQPDPNVRPPLTKWVELAVALLTVTAAVLGLMGQFRDDPAPVSPVAADVLPPPGIAPVPADVREAAPPANAAADSDPVQPEVVPTPDEAVTPSTVPAPKPPSAKTPPPARTPKADPEPAPRAEDPAPEAPTTAHITFVEGGLVRLIGDAGTLSPGTVPPGTYRVRATFGRTEAVDAGVVVLKAGDTRTLKCNPVLLTCN